MERTRWISINDMLGYGLGMTALVVFLGEAEVPSHNGKRLVLAEAE